MTRVILANARLIDPRTNYDGPGSLRIDNGTITGVVFSGQKPNFPIDGYEIIDCDMKCVAPGIVDMNVFIGEPGERHKESFNSGGQAAAAGGVTTIVTQPNTQPIIDGPEMVQFVKHRAKESCIVKVLPMAAMTKGLLGDTMTEYQFIKDSGSVALTNAYTQVKNSRIMMLCMEYAKSTESLIVHHPQDHDLSHNACATSGLIATTMGLSSVPVIAEKIGLERDLNIARITGARYHADQLSSQEALECFKKAKDLGLPVTSSTSVAYFCFDESEIIDYKTFSKVSPPLRSAEDRKSVIKALSNGLIDVIVSAHCPQDEESKRVPYKQAAFGIIGLETILAASLKLYHWGCMSLPKLFLALSLNPSKILGQKTGSLTVGSPADLVVFDVDKKWKVVRQKLFSKSKNTPFHERNLQGQVIMTFVGGKKVFDINQGICNNNNSL